MPRGSRQASVVVSCTDGRSRLGRRAATRSSPRPAASVCAAQRKRPLRTEFGKKAGPQVALDEAALAIVSSQEMDMHFVGAELGAAMADLSEIERYGLVAGTADTQDCSAAAGLAPHQDVVGRRQFRAFNQAKDRMHVLL